MGYKGGIISGSDRSLIGTSRYTNSYGVWKLGEVYQEIKDENWIKPADLSNSTTTTNGTFTYPSNIASGDMLILVSTNTGSTQGTASGAGFTQLMLVDIDPRIYVGYKITDGTESGTFSVSNNEIGICSLFKQGRFDNAGPAASGTSSNITVSNTTVYSGLLIACITTFNPSSTIDAADGMTEIVTLSNTKDLSTSMLYQPSLSNTSYTKNLSFTGAANTRGILINIY